MRKLFLALTIATFTAVPSLARPKLAPLPEATAATLAGKTLAITRRGEKPSFMAMTAGKATFALLGAGAMAVEGNRIVRENGIADPADTVEAVLVPAFVKRFGTRLTPESGHAIAPGNEYQRAIVRHIERADSPEGKHKDTIEHCRRSPRERETIAVHWRRKEDVRLCVQQVTAGGVPSVVSATH